MTRSMLLIPRGAFATIGSRVRGVVRPGVPSGAPECIGFRNGDTHDMLVLMSRGVGRDDVRRVVELLQQRGLEAEPVDLGERAAIRIVAAAGGPPDPGTIAGLPGVERVIPLGRPFGRVERRRRLPDTVVRVGPVAIGSGEPVLIAGPCAVETEQQLLTAARQVRRAGARLLRGGAFKPRTSPYTFQGLGEPGLRLLARAREETGLPVVTEAVDERSLELVERHADMVQIGARNMQNFELLRRVGRSALPVLLKRGMSASLEELLLAAEYVVSEGNPRVVLCERGVRGFGAHARYTLDLSIVPAIRESSHLPVIVDPSHATGKRAFVAPLARAALAAGADGVMIETHPDPQQALCDGHQALDPDEFAALAAELRALAAHLSARPETVT